MPDGRTHRKLHRKFWALPVLSAGALMYYVLPLEASSFIMATTIPVGYWLGKYIDPDLDLPQRTEAERIWRSSCIFFPILAWWWIYAMLAKAAGGHRSFLTHAPFISTAIRLVWFSLPLILVGVYVGISFKGMTEPLGALLSGVYLGLSIADIVHITADIGLLRLFE